MPPEWNPRFELLEIAHRWYQVFLAFLIGSLLGWGSGYLLPSPYRAETGLYVAYNADAIYRNPDDYKNWQLGELDAYIVSDEVLEATLSRLKAQDAYWASLAPQDLRPQLRTYWRNAGKWRLTAEHRQRKYALQLVQAWAEVILERTSQASAHARTVMALSGQIQALDAQQADLHSRLARLHALQAALQQWRDTTAAQTTTQSLDTLSLWRLQSLAASAASLVPADLALLRQPPAPEGTVETYISAVDQALQALEVEISVTQRQLEELTTRHEQMVKAWEAEIKASRNLTAYLTVEPLSAEKAKVRPLRPTSQMALVGGVLGMVVWGLIWLAHPLRKGDL